MTRPSDVASGRALGDLLSKRTETKPTLAEFARRALTAERTLKERDPYGADGEAWDAMYDRMRDVVVAAAESDPKSIGECSWCGKAIVERRPREGRYPEYVHANSGHKRCYRPDDQPPPGPTEVPSDLPPLPSVDEIVDFVEEWGAKIATGIETIRAIRTLNDTITRK